jgi:hypothetical protein
MSVRLRIVFRRRGCLKLEFPLQDSCFGRGGFSFRNVAGLLERDGKSRMGKGIVRRESCQRQCRTDGLFQTSRITQSANQAVVRLKAVQILDNRCAKAVDRAGSISGGQMIQPQLNVAGRIIFIRVGHDIL